MGFTYTPLADGSILRVDNPDDVVLASEINRDELGNGADKN